MATVSFTLVHGLKVGSDVLKDVVMRELTAGDIFAASEAAEKLAVVGEGKNTSYEFVISPTLMAKETLRRQIVSIGTVKGPIGAAELASLHPADLLLLEKQSLVLEDTITPTEVAQRGRSNRSVHGD
jgi:phage FluMu protein gp41